MTVLSFPFQEVWVALSRLYPEGAKLVPFIPLALVGAAAQVPLMLVADSGADYTIVSNEIAPLLGLAIKVGEKTSFCGTSGQQQEAYVHRLDIVIQDAQNSVRYAADVAFASLPRSVAVRSLSGEPSDEFSSDLLWLRWQRGGKACALFP